MKNILQSINIINTQGSILTLDLTQSCKDLQEFLNHKFAEIIQKSTYKDEITTCINLLPLYDIEIRYFNLEEHINKFRFITTMTGLNSIFIKYRFNDMIEHCTLNELHKVVILDTPISQAKAFKEYNLGTFENITKFSIVTYDESRTAIKLDLTR